MTGPLDITPIRNRLALAMDPYAAEDNRRDARLRLLRHDLPALLAEVASITRRPAPSPEQVARLVDPDAWNLDDEQWITEYGHEQAPAKSYRSLRRESSLRTADAVLALFKGGEG